MQYSSNSNNTPGGGSSQIQGIWTFDDPNTYSLVNLGLADALNRETTKMLPNNRPWNVYKNARPYSADQNIQWQETTDYSATTYNGLTRATTYFYIRGYNPVALAGSD